MLTVSVCLALAQSALCTQHGHLHKCMQFSVQGEVLSLCLSLESKVYLAAWGCIATCDDTGAVWVHFDLLEPLGREL